MTIKKKTTTPKNSGNFIGLAVGGTSGDYWIDDSYIGSFSSVKHYDIVIKLNSNRMNSKRTTHDAEVTIG